MDKASRATELIEILNKASKQYYSGNNEIMSNYEYDKLYEELLGLESELGNASPESPTQNVGYEVVGNLPKVRHENKILSLDKTKNIDKLETFLSEAKGHTGGILSWKLDGLTVVLAYSGGVLKQALTRGNGETGEDITHNARVFKNLPKKIPFAGELVLRGEAVISYADFENINSGLPDRQRYKNPRNLCSGTVRQLSSEVCAKRNVNFFAFSLVKASGVDFFDKKSEQMKFLIRQGFSATEFIHVTEENIREAVKLFSEKIPNNEFASDGLVLTYDSISYSLSLGATSKFPKDSVAFKWADETAETTLITIQWNTSRTGLVNPVAIFEPVEIEGTTVNKASLHNVSIVRSLGLGAGDIIHVYKANMIIPQISENLTKSGTAQIPSKCPVCGSATVTALLNGSESLYCKNPNCKAQLINTLVHFASRDAMNIEGLSVKTIEKFSELGLLGNYSDIYALGSHSEQIAGIEGFGKKSVEKLLESIERSKTRQLHHFIYALGIDQVGLANSKLLCRHFGYDIEKIKTANLGGLLRITGFGETIAKSIEAYFSDGRNIQILNSVMPLLALQKLEMPMGSLAFDGKIFVITGDTNIYKNRAELQHDIESNGGKVASSVSRKTAYLINNDNLSASSKNKKALELGIPIITEKMFIDLLGQRQCAKIAD